MKSECFIDTNLWVYALIESEGEPVKKEAAQDLLRTLSPASRIIVSVQVINEFHWTLSRKYNVPETLIQEKVVNGIAALATVVPLDNAIYRESCRLRGIYRCSFWDSLIVAAARQSGCDTLYSEDLSHGMVVEKTLRIVNPFIS